MAILLLLTLIPDDKSNEIDIKSSGIETTDVELTGRFDA